MKTGHLENSLRRFYLYRKLILGVFIYCLFVSMLSLAEDCQFAIQLKDPVIQAEYEAVLAAGSTYDPGQNGEIDPLAVQCLACHDGVLAGDVKYRISDGTLYKVKSIQTILGAHPIGMNYHTASRNPGFAAEDSLPAEMKFMYGNVSCVTCHNLLGTNARYHVVDNSTSGLCFSCHRK